MSKRVQLIWKDLDNINHTQIVILPEGHEEVYLESDDGPGYYTTIDQVADDLIKKGKPRVLFLEDNGQLFGVKQELIISITNM